MDGRLGEPLALQSGRPSPPVLPAAASRPGKAGARNCRRHFRPSGRHPKSIAHLREMGGRQRVGRESPITVYSPWCARGFCVLSETAEVVYKVTQEYSPECEAGFAWNDSRLSIDWSIDAPVLSKRHRRWRCLSPSMRACSALDHSFPKGSSARRSRKTHCNRLAVEVRPAQVG
jgi:hypothetical protein